LATRLEDKMAACHLRETMKAKFPFCQHGKPEQLRLYANISVLSQFHWWPLDSSRSVA